MRFGHGAYICCGMFTNIGALVTLFFFLEETWFALVPIYKLFEEFLYFRQALRCIRGPEGHLHNGKIMFY